MARRRARSQIVDIDPRAVEALLAGGGIETIMDIAAEAVVRAARQAAPKDTGEGARSIRAVRSSDPRGRTARHVSWDATHYYMQFQELGTSRHPAQPFLRPALSRARI